jgi:hypothetical protein
MEDIGLAVVLYLVYCCVISLGLYQPTKGAATDSPGTPAQEGITASLLQEAFAASEPNALTVAPTEPSIAAPPTRTTRQQGGKAGRSQKKVKVINLKKLTTLEARVACDVLNIQQKVNGTDRSVAWMQKAVQRALSVAPERRSAVYTAIHEKYPHLLIPDESQAVTRNLA